MRRILSVRMTLTLTTSDRERQQWSKSEVNKLLYNGKLIIFLNQWREICVTLMARYFFAFSLLNRWERKKSLGISHWSLSLMTSTWEWRGWNKSLPLPQTAPQTMLNLVPIVKFWHIVRVSRFKIKPGGREYDFLPNFVNFLEFIVQICSLHQIRDWRSAIKGQA